MNPRDSSTNPLCYLPSDDPSSRTYCARETLEHARAALSAIETSLDDFGMSLLLQTVIGAIQHAEHLLTPAAPATPADAAEPEHAIMLELSEREIAWLDVLAADRGGETIEECAASLLRGALLRRFF